MASSISQTGELLKVYNYDVFEKKKEVFFLSEEDTTLIANEKLKVSLRQIRNAQKNSFSTQK